MRGLRQRHNILPVTVELCNMRRRASVDPRVQTSMARRPAGMATIECRPDVTRSMNRKLFLLSFAAAISVCIPEGFAQRQSAAGAGPVPLSPLGVLNGVDMSGSATTGTLVVGVPGGPEMDIFSSNSPLMSPFLAVSTGASSQGNIVFNSSSAVYGAIGMTQPGGPFLLDISGGAAGTVVNFMGPVYATTLNVVGTGTLNFNSGSVNDIPNGLIFAGDGTISLAPNTTVIGAITAAAPTNTGTLVLGNGSVLTGAAGAGSASLRAVNVVGGNNIAGGIATISGAVNAYSFSLGTNTLSIGGALTIADSTSSGVINTTLASPSVYGNIRPVGVTTVGTSILINATVPSGALIPVGTVFNIVQTQTGTAQVGSNGRTVLVTDPTNPLYTFSATPTAAGLIQITTTSIPLLAPIVPPPTPTPTPTPPPAVLPIAAVVVPVLLAVPTTPDVVTVLTAVNSLTTPVAVVNAVAQLAPSTPDLAAPLVTFQGIRQFEDLWLSHLDDVMCGQIGEPRKPATAGQPEADTPSCSVTEPHAGGWLKSFGYFGNQGNQGSYPGYSSEIVGTMVGYDAPLLHMPFDGDTRVGIGIGYARSMITGKTFSTSTDADPYQALAYIAHEHGPWFLEGDLSFGWNDYSGSRDIVFPGINRAAQASYNGQDYTAFFTTGYHLFAQGFTITPLASLQYTHMDLDGYTETGAGDIDLSVKSQSYDFLESGLGVKVARPIVYRSGTFVPEFHVKWLHDLVNPTLKNTAAFAVTGSPPFTTPGLRTAADTLDAGAGVTFLACACTGRTWSLEGVYDYFWSSDQYLAQRVMLRFTARF